MLLIFSSHLKYDDKWEVTLAFLNLSMLSPLVLKLPWNLHLQLRCKLGEFRLLDTINPLNYLC